MFLKMADFRRLNDESPGDHSCCFQILREFGKNAPITVYGQLVRISITILAYGAEDNDNPSPNFLVSESL